MTTDAATIARRMGAADVLARLADALESGDGSTVTQLAATLPRPPTTTIRLPIAPPTTSEVTRAKVKAPSLRPSQKFAIYRRDGFVCRLSPERWRLLYPGALRVLSLLLPEAIPTQLSSHGIPARYPDNSPIWWDVWPAVDHVHPRSLEGGTNDPQNLVCVSWWRNDAKSNRSLESTGWQLQPPGDVSEWDGLYGWFTRQIAARPDLRDDVMVRNWNI